MVSHPIDFQLQANVYCTSELTAIFAEQKRISRWLRIEAALAQAQGELGIIPADAAREIDRKATLEHLDSEAIRAGYRTSRNSLMPVVKVLRAACSGDAGDFVHFGATTQDILDTCLVLELEEALQVIYRDLRVLEETVLGHATRHRETAMIGRTHGQQALPVTFGLKAAVWAGEIRRHIERLKHLYPRFTFGQLGGAVGTMAALGQQGREVAMRTMALLNLKWQPPAWHTARDNMAETSGCFALLAGTMEKVANEVFLLSKTEVGELAEQPPGSEMSSTMPHKRNPVLCQRVAALARQVRALHGAVLESMVHEHERDPRMLWSEWLALPQLAMYTGSAVSYVADVLAGLIVDENRMQENLHLQSDRIMSEWLMFRLAPELGRAAAQEQLHDLLRRAEEQDRTLAELLRDDPQLASLLRAGDLEQLARPDRYTGLAPELVDETVRAIRLMRQEDPEVLRS